MGGQWAAGSDPAQCHIHSGSYLASPGSSLQRGRNGREEGEPLCSGHGVRPGPHLVHHTFPFGVSASWASGDKADTHTHTPPGLN